jgi:hypothetical protein
MTPVSRNSRSSLAMLQSQIKKEEMRTALDTQGGALRDKNVGSRKRSKDDVER